jgi:LacI family transcriptional regulator
MVKLTIIDIANMAGVSKSTVSRVINKDKHVSEKTRQKVLAIIKKLGYIPDNIARSLITKKTFTIGLIIPDIVNPFYSETSKIIEDTIRKLGYSLIICNTNNKSTLQNKYLNILIQRKVDGIIFGSVKTNDTGLVKFAEQEVPYITYHRSLANKKSNYVISDDIEGIKIAVKHLTDLGHKNIAYISGPTSFSTGLNRLKGFFESIEIFNLNNNSNLIQEGGFSESKSWQATRKLLNLANPPTAIIAANDLMAISALDCILHHGLTVPKDISLIGFDNINLASHARIQLTTISVAKKKMAKLASELLIKKIINKNDIEESIQIKLQPRLILRRTTGIVTTKF